MAQVGEKGIRSFVAYNRTDRNGDEQVVGIPAELIAPLALSTRFGFEQTAVTEIYQRIDVAVRYEDDIAALAAITAIGAAFGYKFFVTETAHAVSALAGLHKYSCSVYKHIYTSSKKRNGC